MVFWNVTSCNLLRIYRQFEDTFLPCLQNAHRCKSNDYIPNIHSAENFVHVCNTRNSLPSLYWANVSRSGYRQTFVEQVCLRGTQLIWFTIYLMCKCSDHGKCLDMELKTTEKHVLCTAMHTLSSVHSFILPLVLLSILTHQILFVSL
jgi:hypothetical protein